MQKIISFIETGVIYIWVILSFAGIYLCFLSIGENLILFLIGLGMILPMIVYIFYQRTKTQKEAKKSMNDLVEFKEKSSVYEVSLTKYVIKSNEWINKLYTKSSDRDEIEKQYNTAFDEAISDGVLIETKEDSVEVHRNSTIIVFQIYYNEKVIEHEFMSHKDPATLEMEILLKQKTELFISKSNNDEYYLDLTFLE